MPSICRPDKGEVLTAADSVQFVRRGAAGVYPSTSKYTPLFQQLSAFPHTVGTYYRTPPVQSAEGHEAASSCFWGFLRSQLFSCSSLLF